VTSCRTLLVSAHRGNAVWRRGRVFFVCPQCLARCTRLYNYKATPWGRGMFGRLFGTTQRDWAVMTTGEKRQQRAEASRERWNERRSMLARADSLESRSPAAQRRACDSGGS
jgi:hypothetical protein